MNWGKITIINPNFTVFMFLNKKLIIFFVIFINTNTNKKKLFLIN